LSWTAMKAPWKFTRIRRKHAQKMGGWLATSTTTFMVSPEGTGKLDISRLSCRFRRANPQEASTSLLVKYLVFVASSSRLLWVSAWAPQPVATTGASPEIDTIWLWLTVCHGKIHPFF
jgi:hypothetical protein